MSLSINTINDKEKCDFFNFFYTNAIIMSEENKKWTILNSLLEYLAAG